MIILNKANIERIIFSGNGASVAVDQNTDDIFVFYQRYSYTYFLFVLCDLIVKITFAPDLELHTTSI
jgi:hypothetical protein